MIRKILGDLLLELKAIRHELKILNDRYDAESKAADNRRWQKSYDKARSQGYTL